METDLMASFKSRKSLKIQYFFEISKVAKLMHILKENFRCKYSGLFEIDDNRIVCTSFNKKVFK